MDEIIKVNDVSMRFNLAQEKTETLKEYTVKLLTHKLFFNEFYALKHVSFSMKRGESLALIGRNGSGKSTILKVISGVMYPSGGSVAVNGEIAPMIELGAGFDMDLTARENIFLNGAVLGHDRDYMMEHFDRIIEFSELKDFVDVPVKNFSSGMIARLGFSIATEVQADILVCDEVLAVGDFMFQQKCHRRMEERRRWRPLTARCCSSAMISTRCSSCASAPSGWITVFCAGMGHRVKSARTMCALWRPVKPDGKAADGFGCRL